MLAQLSMSYRHACKTTLYLVHGRPSTANSSAGKLAEIMRGVAGARAATEPQASESADWCRDPVDANPIADSTLPPKSAATRASLPVLGAIR